MAPPLTHSTDIRIIGSGVFGLSIALWLARAGYHNVTVFDMQDTLTTGYSPDLGIDSASADWNKIIRFSYGSEIHYQRLAFEAAGLWEEWNREFAAASEESLPESLRGLERRLWFNSGMLRVSAEEGLGVFEEETLRCMERDGLREAQFVVGDDGDVEKARQAGWAHKLDPTQRKRRLGVHRAHLAREAEVKFVLGKEEGNVISIEENGGGERQPVLKTADGKRHPADLVIVAGGGWTPTLLPEVSGLLETTAGSVATIQIPKERKDLWDKYSPENHPVFSWGTKQGKDIYNFPRDEHGASKIGYRHTKYTNFQDHSNGSRMSIPKTAHVTAEKETNIPMQALTAIKKHIDVNLPDLAPFGIASTKLCWYTDSIDNSFVVGYVPGRKGVVVCSGGSGHGFKFLPILGREVVRILEGKGVDGPYEQMWKWRQAPERAKRNGLEDGDGGPRVLAKQKMATPDDWGMKKENARL